MIEKGDIVKDKFGEKFVIIGRDNSKLGKENPVRWNCKKIDRKIYSIHESRLEKI